MSRLLSQRPHSDVSRHAEPFDPIIGIEPPVGPELTSNPRIHP